MADVFGRAFRAVLDPRRTAYAVWSRVDGHSLRRRYQKRARACGLDRLYVALSFDCDTAEDIAVAEAVHNRVRALGIMPAYAVPGALLEEGAETYRRIAADGAEFLNHGNRRHTWFDAAAGRYKSCFFYDEEPLAAVEDDITGGDRTVRAVLGTAPQGFRTPHFGSFQRPKNLAFLHRILKRLGYRYSSSTAPYYGFRHGPRFGRFGVAEIPVSGGFARPLTIIDSWSCFAAPNRAMQREDYRTEILELAHALRGEPGILNYYADPSHVATEPLFFSTMSDLAQIATPTTFAALTGATP